jgi:hypothetical protein
MCCMNAVRLLNDYGMPGMQRMRLTHLLVSNSPTTLFAPANTPRKSLRGISMLYLHGRGPGGGRHPPHTLLPPPVLPAVHMELAGERQHVPAVSHLHHGRHDAATRIETLVKLKQLPLGTTTTTQSFSSPQNASRRVPWQVITLTGL